MSKKKKALHAPLVERTTRALQRNIYSLKEIGVKTWKKLQSRGINSI